MTTATKSQSQTALERVEEQIAELEQDVKRLMSETPGWCDRQRMIADLRERRALILRAAE